MNTIILRFFLTLLCASGMIFSTVASAKDISPESKESIKEMNDLLVKYFTDNCKGENYKATCPAINELTPDGKFNTLAKHFVKNYHFFVFNDQWIWVGHGLYRKIIGGNHRDFQGADGHFFAQGFRKFADEYGEGYYPYSEAKSFGGYKNIAYLHQLVLKDGSKLIFATCYNTPEKLIDKDLLKNLKSKN